MENLYADIAARTGGNIYIGVVGPVRTGKSTLIKRIMEAFVIPNIQDPYRAQRARDELPQSGSGKTIMTSEPKFIPEEAATIAQDGAAAFRIRMIDTVGYLIPGATGADEDGNPRMVATPWYDHEIPMTQAAELGTKKVMDEHSTVGLVVTTDGTVTDIPREDYIEAERRAILDMQATGKPFLVVINTKNPGGEAAAAVRNQLQQEFGLDPLIADCQAMDVPALMALFRGILLAFPIREIRVYFPKWIESLENDHPAKAAVYQALLQQSQGSATLGQAESSLAQLQSLEQLQHVTVHDIAPADGSVCCTLGFPDTLFYEILSEKAGIPITDNAALLELLSELVVCKRAYDQIADGLASAKATGYGVVMPDAAEMRLEAPEILKKNSTYGVRIKAGAPSIHMIRVDVDTQIQPMVGDEQQAKELISYLGGEDPDQLWQSNIFGKSVYAMVRDGLTTKLLGTPEEVKLKFRDTLTKIVNDGAAGLICLIL